MSRIIVQTLSGVIIKNGEPVALTVIERQIVIALALQAHPVTPECLGDLVYPERDFERARDLLKVYVCRLRQRIDRDFIVRDSRGYALGPSVRVDALEFTPLLEEVLRRRALLNLELTERIERVARLLRGERPAYLMGFDWYATAARRFARQGRDVIMTLAKDALDRGDTSETIRLTNDLIYDDSCDEAARELAIQAHLRAGNQGAAAQEFRLYCRTLAEELQATPSRELSAMFSAKAQSV